VSIQAVSWVIGHPEITNRTEWAVMIALANRTSPEGWCWPSHERIARESRSSISTVQRVIDALVERGLIQVVERPGTSSRYFLPLGKVAHHELPPDEEVGHHDRPTHQEVGHHDRPGRSQLDRGGRSQLDRRNIKNRQESSAAPVPVDNWDPLHPSTFVLTPEQKAHGQAELARIREQLRNGRTNGKKK